MHKPKHIVRGLLAQMDTHQKVFVGHTILLIIWFIMLPIIRLNIIESTTSQTDSIMFFSLTFWKSAFIVISMIVAIMLMTFHMKIRHMIITAFGVTDVFINFVCYLVIVATYIGIGDATMAVYLHLTQTISLAGWYYIIGIWLALWLFLHASWSYKYGKQAHQATIINLAAQKQQSNHHAKESFKNLFD